MSLRSSVMLTKRIIPCLDVTAGRVVKGVHFVDLRDAGDPVELAEFYNAEGADELVFLDITASHEQRATMLDVVTHTAEQIFIPVTVGGGIRSVEDIRATLGAGADKTSLNTAAVQNPDVLRAGAEKFGAQCIVLDRKSTRLNSSHSQISYAGFCLKKHWLGGASADLHRFDLRRQVRHLISDIHFVHNRRLFSAATGEAQSILKEPRRWRRNLHKLG